MSLVELITITANDALKADPSLLLPVLQYTADKGAGTAGLQRQAWGFRVGEPETLQWFQDWESFDHRKKVAAELEADADFTQKAKGVFAAPPTIVHVPFAPSTGYSQSINAPVTEILSARLKDGLDYESFKKVSQSALEVLDNTEECLGWALGFTVEDERALVISLGWKSIEAHKKLLATPSYQAVLGPLSSSCTDIKFSYCHMKIHQK